MWIKTEVDCMSKGEKRIYISANSPGEISGWLKPAVKMLGKLLPEYKISVILLPCVFASGREKDVIETLPEVDEVIPSRNYFSLLFDKKNKSDSALLHLGGDITFTAWLAKHWKTTAWGYQWGKKSIDNYYRGYFVKAIRDKEELERRGINSNKIYIVGDLLKDSVNAGCGGEVSYKTASSVETICFMPGSRLKELRSLLPFFLQLAALIKEKYPAMKFKTLVSPYIDWEEFVAQKELVPLKELGGVRGSIDGARKLIIGDNAEIRLVNENHICEMQDSDFLITIPGTKTGEAGCLGKPMAVLLPLNKPEDIPFIGVIGLLDWFPVIGPRIKGRILMSMSRKFGWVAQPNIMVNREIVPEIRGILNVQDVARTITSLLEDGEKLEKIRKELREIYEPFDGATEKMVHIFARAIKPDFDREKPYFSVIICTRNRKDVLKGSLETLDRQDYPPEGYEIIVVDDGSDDGTDEMMASLKTKCRLKYVKRPWSGRAATRNAGIAEAVGEVIIFVDDDILAPPDFVSEHARYHRMYPRTIVRGPIINIENYEFPADKKAGITDFSQAFFCTCNVSVGRRELVDVGGFDETFLEYGYEDNEVGWRLRCHGLIARFNMKAIVYHYKPRKKEKDLEGLIRTAQELARSAILYYQKHPHWKVRLATGIYPFYFVKQWFIANRFIKDFCLKKWKERAGSNRDGLIPLEKKISSYYYTETLREELKKRSAVSGQQSAERRVEKKGIR